MSTTDPGAIIGAALCAGLAASMAAAYRRAVHLERQHRRRYLPALGRVVANVNGGA